MSNFVTPSEWREIGGRAVPVFPAGTTIRQVCWSVPPGVVECHLVLGEDGLVREAGRSVDARLGPFGPTCVNEHATAPGAVVAMVDSLWRCVARWCTGHADEEIVNSRTAAVAWLKARQDQRHLADDNRRTMGSDGIVVSDHKIVADLTVCGCSPSEGWAVPV